ncbi:hypothetical protein B0H13DRAFT_1882659 [Mycena leptocephala]|nr:hypothetical protein B0H13DRAFT_1882659 [Mycena leptocephala]
MREIEACIVSEESSVEERVVLYELRVKTSEGTSGVAQVRRGIDRRQDTERRVDLKFARKVLPHSAPNRVCHRNAVVTTASRVSLTVRPGGGLLARFFGKIWVHFKNYKPRENISGKRVPQHPPNSPDTGTEDPVDGTPTGRVRVKYKKVPVSISLSAIDTWTEELLEFRRKAKETRTNSESSDRSQVALMHA